MSLCKGHLAMILRPADQIRFPKSTRYIRRSLPRVINVPVIVRAMQTTGQLNRAQFQLALTWGINPTINIVAGLPSCASFTPTPGNNIIKIQESIFHDFEAGRGFLRARGRKVQALGVNILHEMVHWGDNKDGIDRPGEEGDEFELLVYGVNLAC